MREAVVLAVDVGGTTLKGALVDQRGETRSRETVVVSGQSGDEAYQALEELCARLCESAARDGLAAVAAGVISPGMDDRTGRVMFSSNLGWRDRPIRAPLERRLGLPVATGHDVRSAGLAEGLLGAGRGVADFAFLMIGTGIAAALVSNDAMIRGAASMGGEVGHAPVYPDGEACPCGQRGCLEAYASAASIARRYRARGGEPLDAAAIVGRQGDDPLARAVWDDAVEALALSLASLTMHLDPALFVLGGGLAEAGPVLIDPLRDALARRLAWREAPPIRRSTLGVTAGRVAAAILAFRRAGHEPDVATWRV